MGSHADGENVGYRRNNYFRDKCMHRRSGGGANTPADGAQPSGACGRVVFLGSFKLKRYRGVMRIKNGAPALTREFIRMR